MNRFGMVALLLGAIAIGLLIVLVIGLVVAPELP